MIRASKKELERFGKRLNEIMEEKGVSASELAKKLGISRQAVDNYRNAVSDPPISKLLKIADIFCVSVDWLLGRDGAVKTIDADIAAVARCTGLTESAVQLLAERKDNPVIPSVNSPYEMNVILDNAPDFCDKASTAVSMLFENGCAFRVSGGIALYKMASRRLCSILNGVSSDSVRKMDIEEYGKLFYEIVEASASCKTREYETKECASRFVDDAIKADRDMCKSAFEKSGIIGIWNSNSNQD